MDDVGRGQYGGAAAPYRVRPDSVDVINDLAGAAKPVEIKLFGSDSTPRGYAQRLAPDLEGVPPRGPVHAWWSRRPS